MISHRLKASRTTFGHTDTHHVVPWSVWLEARQVLSIEHDSTKRTTVSSFPE